MADKFTQEHPNISITVEAVAYGQFWEKMQPMAAGKNLPDVFWMSSGTVKDYAKMGSLLDIDDRVAKLDQSKYFPNAFNVLRAPNFPGKMYAFPWAVVNSDKSRGLFRGIAALFRAFDADIRPILSYADGVDSLTFYSISN